MPEKTLHVKVIANSKINKIIKLADNTLKIKIAAPAAEGKANKVLTELLAKHYKTPKRNIEIIKGLKSANKKIRLIL